MNIRLCLGGEKQRIAIARVLLKNPDVILFDEPTSALDSTTEGAILDQIDEISQNKSSIIIAHRLSTIMDADEILVIGGNNALPSQIGTIVERGTHGELLALKGNYYDMWQQQISSKETQ